MWLCIAALVTQAYGSDLRLVGMAEFSELRRPYYIGAFYTDSVSEGAALASPQGARKRMELRVVAARWSQRRFSAQWSQSFFINNSQQQLLQFSDELLKFQALPGDELLRGDRIVIEAGRDGIATLSVNGIEQFRAARPGFLELLLAKWMGEKPPTTEFKQGILGVAIEPLLLQRYQALAPTPARIVQLAEQREPSSIRSKRTAAKVVATQVVPLSANSDAALATKSKEGVLAVAEKSPDTSTPIENTTPLERSVPEPAATSPLAEVTEQISEESDIDDAIGAEQYAAQQHVLVTIYQNSVADHIRSFLKYPKRALQLRQEGTMRIRLTVDRSGHYLDQSLVSPSKFRLLNEAAFEAVKDSVKAPALPTSLDVDSLTIEVPFVFGSAER